MWNTKRYELIKLTDTIKTYLKSLDLVFIHT